MAFTLVRRLARHVKARRAQWTAETDRAFHDAIFAAQDFDPFDPAYPGRITIRRFADLASPYVAQAGSVADLGCGPGEITCELAARFPSIRFTGWDHSQAAIDRARHLASSKALTNVDFAMADIGRMRVPDRSDLAMMFDSFHHLPQPAQFVASNTHVPRWFLVEPAGDALGRWRYTVDLDWVLQELDKIRWRLEHQLNVTAAAPRDRAAKSEEPAPGPDGAVEFRYALDDYLGFFDGYGVSAVGTSAGIVKYPPAPHIGSPLRKAFNEFSYQLLCDADAALRSRDEDLAARHWAIYCARGETFEAAGAAAAAPGREGRAHRRPVRSQIRDHPCSRDCESERDARCSPSGGEPRLPPMAVHRRPSGKCELPLADQPPSSHARGRTTNASGTRRLAGRRHNDPRCREGALQPGRVPARVRSRSRRHDLVQRGRPADRDLQGAGCTRA